MTLPPGEGTASDARDDLPPLFAPDLYDDLGVERLVHELRPGQSVLPGILYAHQVERSIAVFLRTHLRTKDGNARLIRSFRHASPRIRRAARRELEEVSRRGIYREFLLR